MKKINHLVYWGIIIVTLTLIFGYSNAEYIESFYFVTMLLPVMVGTSYFFNSYLVPRFLFEKRYFKFILFSLYTIIISVYFEMLVIMLAFVLLANYQFNAMNPATTNVFVLTVVLYCIVFLTGFISLIKQSFGHQAVINTYKAEEKKQKAAQLLVRSNRQTVAIDHDDIALVESLADYVKIVKQNGESIVTKEKISALSDKLPASFLRIHRSFLVNRKAITAFTRESVTLSDSTFPISRTYKKEVLEKLESSKEAY